MQIPVLQVPGTGQPWQWVFLLHSNSSVSTVAFLPVLLQLVKLPKSQPRLSLGKSMQLFLLLVLGVDMLDMVIIKLIILVYILKKKLINTSN